MVEEEERAGRDLPQKKKKKKKKKGLLVLMKAGMKEGESITA